MEVLSPDAMSYQELVEEIQYVASLLDDQPHHHDAYLAELAEALLKKSKEELAE